MARKTVYWHIAAAHAHNWIIRFWTRPDQTNALSTPLPDLDESKMRKRIEQLTGMVHFDLIQAPQTKGKK